MDVCLVKTFNSGLVYQSIQEFAAVEVPVWSALMADYLRKRKYSVIILDAEASRLTLEETAQRIEEIGALLTVFVVYGHQPSASSQLMPDTVSVHDILKSSAPFMKTLLVGTHPSALPAETLVETRSDFVCTGEGPVTVSGLVDIIKFNGSYFQEVGSLCYREENEIRITKSASLADLDADLSTAAWDLLPMSAYKAHNWHCFGHINERRPYASLYTSLGCPFKCSFCCINAPFGKSTIRYLNPEHVIKEIDILVNDYGVKNIKIPDEMFVLHKNHVISICDLIIERKYDLNIWAYARIDTVQDIFLEKLKLAGFNWLALGIESGSEYVRNGALKQIDENDIRDTVRKIQSHGINVCANYIYGLPDDTYESMEQTMQMAIELNAEWANFYCAMAYPGSPLHSFAKSNNIELPEGSTGPGWIGYSQHAYETFPLRNEHLSRSDIIKFRDESHIRYFERTEYLEMLETKFGTDTRSHVEKMNSVKLSRKFIDE